MKTAFTFLLLFLYFTVSIAQDGYPKPTAKDIIFYIQHNKSKNTYTYQPNYSNIGKLDEKNPLIIKRQLFEKNGEIKPLTAIQKRYAYGIKSSKIDKNNFDIRLVSYPRQKLLLKVDENHEPYIETVINGKTIIVKRLFIKQKEGTSGLNTKIDYIIFEGVDNNKNQIQEYLYFEK